VVNKRPPQLYKYQPYNTQTLDNLKNRIIWFSTPEQFNDPFDCGIPFELPEGTWPEGLIAKRNSFRIACFSECVDNLQMWSHYADGHRGFCLEFSGNNRPFSVAVPVKYYDENPIPNLEPKIPWEQMSKERKLRNQAKMQRRARFVCITTKSSGWSYEKEWRLAWGSKNGVQVYDASLLTGIYLGCAMPSVHKEIVAQILNGSPTQIYEMRRSETKFKVEITKYSLPTLV
jgi:hypothetical protein